MSVLMPHNEHGVQVHFTTADSWQFGTCPAYQRISGKGIKEMDLGWWDAGNNTLWLVELKAFYNPANPHHVPVDLSGGAQDVNYWIDELFKKSFHTLCMTFSNRQRTQSCLPAALPVNHRLRLVYLLRPQAHQAAYLAAIQTALQSRLKDFTTLFAIDGIAVLDYDEEVRLARIPWIV